MAGRELRGYLVALCAGAVLGTAAQVLVGWTDPTRDLPLATDAIVLSATSDRDELRSAAEHAVLRVDVEACGKLRQGTVSMVRTSHGPLGITNAHVVRGAESVELSGAGLGVAQAEVLSGLDGLDLARVDVGGLEPPADAALEVGGEVQVGDPVMTAGFPDGRWKVETGHVVDRRHRTVAGGVVEMIVVGVQARPGLSGGVVIDTEGRVVGVIAERDPRTGQAVAYPIAAVRSGDAAPVSDC